MRENSKKRSRFVKESIIMVLMLACAAIILYPFFMMLMISLKSTKEALISPNTFPKELHWENFRIAWEKMKFPTVFANTVFITVLSLFGIIVLSGLAAYIIAWSKHQKFYNFIYLFFLCGIMIPFYTALVPLVKLMTDFHLNNSLTGMVIYYCGRNMPMAVFLYTGFVRGIPREILEAGRVDGANLMQLYWKVLFPIMKPITSTILVLDALQLWNDFLFPRIMLTSNKLRTITMAQYYFRSENSNQWGLAFAAFILSIVPIIIFYFAFQKNIVKGVAAGAVKG
ncbi:carbohydrate ABC transporter permease [Clostridium sp. chh4-2]|uniref:carbohydrate ABC transporter permease n=1 Tax=Clostridium sp. chh4-2 TaxID=2067550 RepID=UPI000CCE0A27|nr:carbohydrate ABC transporter permease [Clostridium sp. chh4-2]PNV61353.1 carbohydrate ABC transporter permease [Clostridium sp. chh4-2]